VIFKRCWWFSASHSGGEDRPVTRGQSVDA
jgi:hypothetical protein